MTQFDHTADLHVNHTHVSFINPASGIHTAWESATDVFAGICENFAANDDSEFLLVAGDVFNHGAPNAESYERVADALKLATASGKEVVMGHGNHELIRVRSGQRNPLTRFGDLPNVSVYDQPSVHRTKSGAQIVVVPWPSKAAVVADLNLADFDMGDIDAVTSQRLVDYIEQAVESCNDEDPMLMLGHFTVNNIATSDKVRRGSETDISSFFSEPVAPTTALEPFDYVALGHIHVRQNVAHNIWYPGSPDRISFREAAAPKTFNRVTVTESGTTVDHVDTKARQLAVVDLSEELPDLSSMEGATVRLLLPEGMTDDDALLDVFADAGINVHETKAIETDDDDEPKSVMVSDVQGMSMADQLNAWFDNHGEDSGRDEFMATAEAVLAEVGQVEAERG